MIFWLSISTGSLLEQALSPLATGFEPVVGFELCHCLQPASAGLLDRGPEKLDSTPSKPRLNP